ncbi:MAG: type IV toxin-antitoxin system AbiEi family antitoxin domain-containing protein [Spirochaeta sp.]|jgi:hypothetical protein|nr:type IV toxin-antitoxin system AbiEi family antitoxin domain-containing protein [Spirochaeta sp.]
MQALEHLRDELMRLASANRYLFSSTDLRALFPDQSDQAFRALLTRATRSGVLRRVCRGIYIFPYVTYPRGYELYHAAARLRADTLTWISLETALSDAGVISQIPVGRITLMSTGRTSTISCGPFGTIEFHHTKRDPNEVAGNLVYDPACRLWRATPDQALRDLRAVGRSLDLVNREVLDDAL